MGPISGPPPKKSKSPVLIIVMAACCCIVVVAVAIFASILYPVFAQARERAKMASCETNVKQTSLAMQQYVEDYDETYPDSSQWMDSTQPYTKNWTVYHCPEVPGKPPDVYGYACNNKESKASVASIESPALTELIYDSTTLSKNASDPVSSLPSPPRHLGEYNTMGFADGHVKATPAH